MVKIAWHQLFITTVHGTWGRGFFPRRQRQNRRLWFEEESPFLDRLIDELGDIPHKSRRYFGPVKTQFSKEIRPLAFSRTIYRLNTLNIHRLPNLSSPTATVAILHSALFTICKSAKPPSYTGQKMR